MTKSKKKPLNYNEIRKQHLLEDNEKEDKIIKQLSKKLKMNRNTTNCKKKKENTPLWLTQCGFDYLLNFNEQMSTENDDADTKTALCTTVGVLPKKKKRKTLDLYGQVTIPDRTNILNFDHNENHGDQETVVSSNEEVNNTDLVDEPNEQEEVDISMVDKSDKDLYKSIRNSLNRLSESQMSKIISELCRLFTQYPRASVRSCIIEEVCNLVECTQVNRNSKMGWLHQELAVCLTCVQVSLHSLFQSAPLIGYLIESIIFRIFPGNSEQQLHSSNAVISYSVFLAYLYRFGVISGTLILDILKAYLRDCDSGKVKAGHFITIAVGVNLRKFNLSACQEVICQANEQLTKYKVQNSEISYDLEGLIQRLSEKRSTEECITRSMHLHKLIRVWTKGLSITDDMCLSVGLEDLLNSTSTGRWWLVGSAVNRPSDICTIKSKEEEKLKPYVNPEIEAVAEKLGLRTASRQLTFSILVSTPGGPDATASALLKACHTSANSTGVQLGAGAVAAREREMIHIVLHCVMSEMPFNRFYPRVLGGILNCHRRFLMMIKCGFWDILNNTNLTVEAKSNAGRALGLICLVYNFPLTVLKNYNFGDSSQGNIAFLQYAIMELCIGEYQNVLTKLMQLSAYTRLCRNCRIFMRKHFINVTDDEKVDKNTKAVIAKLVIDMREAESF